MTDFKPIEFYDEKSPYYEFSNFYNSEFILDGKTWQTAEHYFQSNKFDNVEYAELIRISSTPNKAFILARQVKKGGYASKWSVSSSNKMLLNDAIDKYKDIAKIKNNWDDIKLDVMRKAIYAKFTQSTKLKKMLIDTYPADIIENSPRDSYWGIGKDKNGENHLGKLLVELRTILKNE